MKLPTDFVIRRNVLALPETAASGATAMRHRMCFTPDRMLALISCTQTSSVVNAADAQLMLADLDNALSCHLVYLIAGLFGS